MRLFTGTAHVEKIRRTEQMGIAAGTHIDAVSCKVPEQRRRHPLTGSGIEKFETNHFKG